MKDNKILKLFLTFLKIGAFTFGGGYAMIPIIQRETVEKHGWVNDDEILEMLAISESTPGPIAINSATFVGYRVAGFWGSLAATCGVILPSLFIITIIAFFLRSFSEYKAVRYAFAGIRAGVAALVLKGFLTMYKKCPKNIFSYTLVAAAFVLVTFFDLSAILIIACGGACGLIFSLAFAGKGDKHGAA
jgi:chromate transporter